MKNKLLILFIASAVLLSTFSFTSCSKKDKNADIDSDEQRSTTVEAFEITDIPVEKKDIIKLFNQSVDNIRYYGEAYTKTFSRTITDIDVESLNTVSNSVDAFKSIFGQADLKYYYNYKKSKEEYLGNLPKAQLDEDEVISEKIEQDEDVITISFELTAVKNPSAESSFSKLCDDYISPEDIQANLKEFNSKAGVTSVTADNIQVVARINRLTSNLIKYTVEFKESFNLIDVTLVDIAGKDVTAKSTVKVVYDNFS